MIWDGIMQVLRCSLSIASELAAVADSDVDHKAIGCVVDIGIIARDHKG
jgi:hypothetical protein